MFLQAPSVEPGLRQRRNAPDCSRVSKECIRAAPLHKGASWDSSPVNYPAALRAIHPRRARNTRRHWQMGEHKSCEKSVMLRGFASVIMTWRWSDFCKERLVLQLSSAVLHQKRVFLFYFIYASPLPFLCSASHFSHPSKQHRVQTLILIPSVSNNQSRMSWEQVLVQTSLLTVWNLISIPSSVKQERFIIADYF